MTRHPNISDHMRSSSSSLKKNIESGGEGKDICLDLSVDKKEKEKEIVECCYNCGAIFISLITIF